MPVVVPPGVDVDITGSHIRIKGPKGELEYTFSNEMDISLDGNVITVQRPSDERQHRALHGTTRAIINNMVVGVSSGFEKTIEIVGVGYRAELDGKNLVLNVGYSHPVVMEPPKGVNFEIDPRSRQIKVTGYDKQQVGETAAKIRKVRPPEPYLGKGIKYRDEKIRRKAGKTGKA
jgi:large subunit ribosomal protein L6